MKKQWSLVLLGLCLGLSLSGSADQLYIRNRPFKGQATQVGKNFSATQVDLEAFCQAAEYQVTELEGNWVVHKSDQTAALPEGLDGSTGKLFVADKELPFVVENGLKMVSLKELGDALGARISHNSGLKTVDVNFAKASGKVAGGGPSGGYTVVNFTAPWCKYCVQFAPTLSSVTSEVGVEVVKVNVDRLKAGAHQNYKQYYNGGGIPYTVLVDPNGKAVGSWGGALPEDRFRKELKRLVRR